VSVVGDGEGDFIIAALAPSGLAQSPKGHVPPILALQLCAGCGGTGAFLGGSETFGVRLVQGVSPSSIGLRERAP
jgi:hypothetical protein